MQLTTRKRAQLQRLIDRAVKLNKQYHIALHALDKWCEEQYGVAPSDVDADFIIDAIYGGCGGGCNITADHFDREMTESMERNPNATML